MSCTCASILMSSVKLNPRIFAVVENNMSLRPIEREVHCTNHTGDSINVASNIADTTALNHFNSVGPTLVKHIPQLV